MNKTFCDVCGKIISEENCYQISFLDIKPYTTTICEIYNFCGECGTRWHRVLKKEREIVEEDLNERLHKNN